MLWGKNRGKWKRPAVAVSRTQDTCLDPPVLCHWATTDGQPPTLTILYMYCTDGAECLSRTPGSHSACVVRTPSGVNRKIVSVRKEPMLSGFLTLNAGSIFPQAGNKGLWGLVAVLESPTARIVIAGGMLSGKAIITSGSQSYHFC